MKKFLNPSFDGTHKNPPADWDTSKSLIVTASFCKSNQTRHQFSCINHHMGFNTAFAPTFLWGPSSYFEDVFKQADDWRIDNKRLLNHFDFESAVRQKPFVLLKKWQVKLSENLTGQLLFSVWDRRPPRGFGYSSINESVLPCLKTCKQFSHWGGSTKRTVQHRDQMLPNTKGVVVKSRLVFGNHFRQNTRIN